MNRKLSALFLCLFLAPITGAAKTILPDACGDDKVKFDVMTEKGKTAPAAPSADKAQIVFIETLETYPPLCIGCDVTTRIGLDGAWVGAIQGKSYFAYTVEPGEHHVCADWQSVLGYLKKKVGLDDFVADPGRVYYYQIKVKVVNSGSYSEHSLDLAPVSVDQGKYLVKISAQSTATQRK